MSHQRTVTIGEALPPLELPPLTRATLALYAGGSGDHIPLHIDRDFAQAAGHRDQFMHGMLGAAYLARLLTGWAPQECLRDFRVRFQAITWPGEVLVATGTVEAVDDTGAATVAVELRTTAGDVKMTGQAVIDFTRAPGSC